MKRKLSTQLSVGFVLIVLITVSIISLTANILIHQQFEKYVAKQQKAFSEELAEALAPQYDSITGEWNLDYIHGFGMYALNDGYIIKLYDKGENVVWDAENHDMTLCHQVMQEISSRMEEKHPELDGEFLTYRYDLNQDNNIVGYIDVRTQELMELSHAVNHMAGCLETQETIRRRLTSDVAHELRTPIANVSSHLEAIIEGVWEPTTERLQSCYDELGRISDMISDLEKLRQIEDENMILEKEPVDLLELSQAVQCAFEQELGKKQLTCKVGGEAAVVFGDQKRLHQVIFNLVSNAIKYSTEGGCINIIVRNETDTAALIIEDRGIGISEKDLPLIFERFYRTDRSRNRKTGGAGIDLTIVRAIIQAHGGTIKVESKEGYGSKFIITLPKRKVDCQQ